MRKKSTFSAVLVFFFLLLTSVWAIPTAPFTVISTASQSLTVTFENTDWQIDTVKIDGVAHLRILPQLANSDAETGSPQNYFVTTLLGIPQDGNVSVTIIDSKVREITADVLPVPRQTEDNGVRHKIYEKDAAQYRQTTWQPANLAEIAQTGYFRNQRVATLRVNPIQILPAGHGVRLYEYLKLQITFSGTTPGESQFNTASERSDQPSYAKALLNGDQAKNWRIPRQRTLRKNTAAFDQLYKIPVTKDGIYKVTGAFLRTNGIDLSGINSATFKILNNGGRELATILSTERPDGLVENAILVNDGGDNKFDDNDYLLFYGRAVNGVEFNPTSKRLVHYLHHYDIQNIYWLTWGGDNGKRMATVNSVNDNQAAVQLATRKLYFREDEINNLEGTGTQWFGEYMTLTNNQKNYHLTLPAASPTGQFDLRLKTLSYAATYTNGNLDIKLNGKVLPRFSFKMAPYYSSKSYEAGEQTALVSGLNELSFTYSALTANSQSIFDYIELEYDADLRATDDVLFFYSPLQTNNARYGLSDFSSDQIQLFDISDYANIKQISAEKTVNQTLEFVAPCRTDSINSYLALSETGYIEPASISADNFISDLRDPANSGDYLIIAPDFFMDQAQRLADYREQYSGFNSIVVNINDVFDEFSAGIQDPVAIRDFLSWAYANWQLPPRLVLLFGDGHYDYKNNLGSSFHNWILPYETYEISEDQGRASDEFFTWIYGTDTYDDIAIGRFPCQTLDDATAMVDKIIAYETNPAHGEWKNTITLLADDEFVGNGDFESWNTIHVNDSERLAQSYIPSTFDLSKIYLTEYPRVSSASITGYRKPTASEAFINQINRGTLIMNFIGHANEIVFTDERILTLTDAQQRIDNGANQAFWIAATCEWGRYDMPEAQAMSENILLMPQGGAIGLLASSRTAYAGDNFAISQLFYRQIFPVSNNSYEHGETTMVGEALMLARNLRGSSVNDEKYHILGDPALKIAIPRLEVALNTVTPDTFKALGKITVNGTIYMNNTPIALNGSVFLKAFDSENDAIHTLPDNYGTMNYTLPGNAVFRGPISVTNGQFSGEFIIPKDINYGGDRGRISAYFWNDELDGSGKRDSLAVGGTAIGNADVEGPGINIQFKDMNAGDGASVGPQPVLAVTIADSGSGVNITGEIGHKIMMTLDEDSNKKRDMTDFFVFDEGSYQTGTLEYALTNFLGSTSEGFDASAALTSGEHTVTVKAWDVYNNSAAETISFIVIEEGDFKISELLNYPNPMRENTTISFFITHNAGIKINIFTIAGRLIRTIEDYAEAGFNQHIHWDGRDFEGDAVANGVYLYQVKATSTGLADTKKTEEIGRAVIMR